VPVSGGPRRTHPCPPPTHKTVAARPWHKANSADANAVSGPSRGVTLPALRSTRGLTLLALQRSASRLPRHLPAGGRAPADLTGGRRARWSERESTADAAADLFAVTLSSAPRRRCLRLLGRSQIESVPAHMPSSCMMCYITG